MHNYLTVIHTRLNNVYLHLVLEAVCITIQVGVFLQLTQYNAFFEEKDLSLMPSGGCLHFRRFLPHCKDSLKENEYSILIK